MKISFFCQQYHHHNIGQGFLCLIDMSELINARRLPKGYHFLRFYLNSVNHHPGLVILANIAVESINRYEKSAMSGLPLYECRNINFEVISKIG